MSEEYGNDFITLTGENGEEVEVEHLATLEIEGELYAAFTDADLPEDAEAELYILKLQEEDEEEGEGLLVTVDDEAELEKVYNIFLDYFNQEEPQE